MARTRIHGLTNTRWSHSTKVSLRRRCKSCIHYKQGKGKCPIMQALSNKLFDQTKNRKLVSTIFELKIDRNAPTIRHPVIKCNMWVSAEKGKKGGE